mgnify:CR=1 FL=1
MSTNRATLSYDQLVQKLRYNVDFLDTEIGQQADLYQMIIEESCALGDKLSQLKIQLDTEKAITELKVRKTFENNAVKATEGKVEAEVKTDATLVQLKLDVAQAETEYDRWYGLKKAWEMRQSSIDSTVRMILSGYLAYKKPTPVGP